MSDLPTAAELRSAMRDKVSQLQSDLTAAKAEIEALKGQLEQSQALLKASEHRAAVATEVLESEATAHTKLKNSIHSGAWLLRKQAEAFECEAEINESKTFSKTTSLYSFCLRDSAQRLRQQADELDHD